jgi:hypothetical protein
MWFVIILLIAAIIYLLTQVSHLKAHNAKIAQTVKELAALTGDIVGLSGDPKRVMHNIEKYLHMRHKHRETNIYKLILSKEKTDLIDWEAVTERQRKELNELYSKLVKESQTSDNDEPNFPLRD